MSIIKKVMKQDDSMKVYRFENGPFMVNTFVALTDDEQRGFILDPGSDIQPLIEELKKRNTSIEAIVATHAHIDHIAGVNLVRKNFDVPFYLNQNEHSLARSISMQAGMFGVSDPGAITVENDLPESGHIEIAGIKLELFHTPGHSPGSISLLADNVLFSGDALFQMSIGRTDLPGGDYNTLINSIREKLFTLPDDTSVLPGHGPETSIGFEKKSNPFLQ